MKYLGETQLRIAHSHIHALSTAPYTSCSLKGCRGSSHNFLAIVATADEDHTQVLWV